MIARRDVLKAGLAGSTALTLGWPRDAFAQAPTQINMFIPAAPGGGWDQTGRSIELAMRTDGIVQTFQFENVGGAGGAVGLPKFLSTRKGAGDAMMVAGMVMVGSLIANKSPVKMTEATPLARLTGEFLAVVVPAQSPFKTLKDLAAALKADPSKISVAGGSAGGSDHILAGMIAKAVGVEAKAVNYVAYAGGGPALAALLGNQVSCGISGYGEFAEQLKAGKLRLLAISADKRQEGIDAPTIKEQGFDVELFNWRGVFGGPGLSAAQRDALIGLVDKMVKGPTWAAELKRKDWTGIYLPGDAFAKFLDAEIARIDGILKDLGLA